jgi:hypothetical protein
MSVRRGGTTWLEETDMRSSILLALLLGCGSAAAPPPVVTPAGAPSPQTLDIPAAALPPHGTLMLGDMHGTREIPAFVGRLAAAVAARERVVLALEIPPTEAAAVQAFVRSEGSAAARQRLVAGPWWQAAYQDGRRSVAMTGLLETVRALRTAGKPIDVVAIDDGSEDAEAREAAMARNVIAARRAQAEAALIVYAGNLHTSKHEVRFRPGFAWMAMRVAAAGIPLVSLNARWADGTAWICSDAVAEHCGVAFLGGAAEASGIVLAPSPDGQYDGWFGVGAVTASPPAGIPAMAVGLDGKIAAAGSSPQAVHARARRAYADKRYDRCAELLGQIADADAGTAYDHACCLALAGRKDDALTRLRYAIAAGFQDLAHLEADPDLASLHGDPRWPVQR